MLYKEKKSKYAYKRLKTENFEGKKHQKIRFLGQKVCPVARERTHTHTKVNTEDIFFPSTFLQGWVQL